MTEIVGWENGDIDTSYGWNIFTVLFAWCYLWVIALMVGRSQTTTLEYIVTSTAIIVVQLSQKVLVLTNMYQREQWTNDSRNIENMQIHLTDECVKGLIRSIAFFMTSIMADVTGLNVLFSPFLLSPFSLSLFLQLSRAWSHTPNTCKHVICLLITSKSNILITFTTQRISSKAVDSILVRFNIDIYSDIELNCPLFSFHSIICGYSWGLLTKGRCTRS